MTTPLFPLPPIVSRAEWLAARKQLLTEEKALTRMRDALAAKRRRLPMVKIEKDYVFAGPAGPVSLREVFGERRQLYVHHFMWNDERGHCPGCSGAADSVFDNPKFRSALEERDVRFVAISRAPLTKIEATRKEKGWTFPWYSSEGDDFNYDFHVTLDETKAPIDYNYRNKEELIAAGLKPEDLKGDWTVNSVFLRDGDAVYHTYSAFARGLDHLATVYNFLDLTPYGRQEDWEDSPKGWPQRPTYG
ncbi:MAG TPA: DUF899 domain-containing protein [Opitutus sp.]|nr:DUF899 domain-containing protein [Opitutus sp.]